MYLSCPNTNCGAEVEMDFEEVSNGDGAWLQTYAAAYIVTTAGTDEHPACEAGCLLTPEQVAQLEDDAHDSRLNAED